MSDASRYLTIAWILTVWVITTTMFTITFDPSYPILGIAAIFPTLVPAISRTFTKKSI